MRARLVDLGLAVVGLGAAVHAASAHGLYRRGAPGDGLFPFVAAVGLLVFVTLALTLDLLRRRLPPGAGAGSGVVPMVAVVTALLGLYAVVLPRAGYPLTTAALLLVVARLASPRPPWARAAVLAAGLAGATFLLFARGLGVPLPAGPRWW